MSDLAPTALELRVMLDRLPGVVYPCLTCGGRGSWDAMVCPNCSGDGEERNLSAIAVAYPKNETSEDEG